MKLQIRKGVFETNSSSQHSLVVTKIDEKYNSEEIMNGIYLYDGVWHIYSHSIHFGRSPFRALRTFADKWQYACASLVSEYNDDIYKELERIAKESIPELQKIKLPSETECLYNRDSQRAKNDQYVRDHGKTEEELIQFLAEKEKKWNVDDISYWSSEDGNYWFYQDISTGMVDDNILQPFLDQHKISLEEFLTNKKYVIIQDGDEYCYYEDFKKSGLINMDMIEMEYPDYN